MIWNENNLLTDDELFIVIGLLKESKQACLYIGAEHASEFRVLNHIWGGDF